MSSAIRLNHRLTSTGVLDQLSGGFVPAEKQVELSVVMPCLNERETVRVCVRKAIATLREAGIKGEVIVADNGSTDGSVEIAQAEGARVVSIDEKGYGNALKAGILASRGEYVLMADSDDSYNFAHIPRFVEQLRAGSELAMGNQFPAALQTRRCPSSIDTWETLLSPASENYFSVHPVATFTAACVVFAKTVSVEWIYVRPAWNSQARW